MALYRITNLKNGTIVLPPPLGRRLNRGETISISAPAGMTEANFNRQYSALAKMSRTGIVAIKTVEDKNVDDNVEVATVSMILANISDVIITTAGTIVYVEDGDFVLRTS